MSSCYLHVDENNSPLIEIEAGLIQGNLSTYFLTKIMNL